MEVEEALKQIRKALNYTQSEFANKLHTSVTTVSRWESGKSRPSKLATAALTDLCTEKNIDSKLIDVIRKNK